MQICRACAPGRAASVGGTPAGPMGRAAKVPSCDADGRSVLCRSLPSGSLSSGYVYSLHAAGVGRLGTPRASTLCDTLCGQAHCVTLFHLMIVVAALHMVFCLSCRCAALFALTPANFVFSAPYHAGPFRGDFRGDPMPPAGMPRSLSLLSAICCST